MSTLRYHRRSVQAFPARYQMKRPVSWRSTDFPVSLWGGSPLILILIFLLDYRAGHPGAFSTLLSSHVLLRICPREDGGIFHHETRIPTTLTARS